MKKQRSRKSFSLDDSIDEDRRKEEIIQKLIESSTNLKPKKLPVIKFDLEENEIPQQPIKQNITEYLTPQVVHNNLDMVRENLQIAMEEKLEESRCLNWTQLVVEFIKIIAYCDVLIQDKCSNQNSFWFFMMFLRDVDFEAYNRLQKQQSLLKQLMQCQLNMRVDCQRRDPHKQKESLNILWQAEDHIMEIYQRKLNNGKVKCLFKKYLNPHMLLSINLYRNTIKCISILKLDSIQFYLFGDYCNQDKCVNLKLYYIHFRVSFFWEQLHQQLNQFICYHSNFVLVLQQLITFLFLRKTIKIKQQINRDQEVIQNLQKLTKTGYDYELCYLCQQEIKHLTVYIDLPCNKMHRFHEKCIEKWLYTNLVCPVCVEPIELMNYQMRILS